MENALKRSLVATGLMLVAFVVSPGVVFAQPPGNPPGQENAMKARVEALEAQVGALMQTLAAETAAREAADAALQMQIDNLGDAAVAETAAREAADTALQMQIDNLGDAAVVAGFVTVNPDPMNGLAGPHIIFEGANVHVRSGSGATNEGATPSGLGNLVVGYNEDAEPDDIRTGSHNLVVGPEHTYSSYGGFVAGSYNAVTGTNASVSGGHQNWASGPDSSVSGGVLNVAQSQYSSVSGGKQNKTSIGLAASISGGEDNRTPGDFSSILGGKGNSAAKPWSSVGGGVNKVAFFEFGWRACNGITGCAFDLP